MNFFEKWISGFVSIADGIIQVLTFGIYCPYLELKWCSYCVLSKKNKHNLIGK